MKICTVDGCGEKEKCKGLCSNHYRRLRVYGRLHRVVTMNNGAKCSVDGCKRLAAARGQCQHHYKRNMRKADLPGLKHTHPFHAMWFERKNNDDLSDEWLDFWDFVKGVGEKPGKFFTLVKVHEGRYGPDNFRWRPHLKREPGETIKTWHARKWQARKEANPGWDWSRTVLKKYGLTQDDFKRMSIEQGGACAICRSPEIAIDAKSGNRKNLSIDHCHTTGKVRGLLCWRCNTTIGKVNESIELLEAMQVYLRCHLACEVV